MHNSMANSNEFPSDNKDGQQRKGYKTHLKHSMFEYFKWLDKNNKTTTP